MSREPPEVVGRTTELQRIREWVGSLENGPRAIVITGEPGIGKTTVWEAIVAAATASGARVLVARPAEAELPLGHAGLGDLLGPVAPTLLPALPDPQARAIAAALGLETGDNASDPALIARATLSALRRLTEVGPVVVAIDDVQWLDPPSASALAFAVRRLDGLPLGIAVTLRAGHDDPIGIRSTLAHGLIELELSGLTLGALGLLLRARVDPSLTRHRLVHVRERSGGNPFYALELSRLPDDALPSSMAELVERRLREAPRKAIATIELVAVRGPTPVAAIAGPHSLDAAITTGVLAEHGGVVRFAHPLFAAGAYARIAPGRRRDLHRQAALAAESLEDRARHLALAATRPDEETAGLLERAAVSARSRGAPQSAVELAAEAVRLTPADQAGARSRRLMDQAEYLVLVADESGARQLVDHLLAAGARGATRVRALIHASLTENTAQRAVALLEEAVGEPHDDGLLAARALAQLAWQRGAWLGDLEPAVDEALRSVRAAEELGDPGTLVTALTTAGLVTSIACRPGADVHFRRALEIQLQHPRAAADHTPRLAFAHERWWRGDFAVAQDLLDAERRLAEDQGDDGLLMRLNVFGAELAMHRGRWEDAAQLLDEALADARAWWRAVALTDRAILRARRGDARARDDVAEARTSPIGDADPVHSAATDFVLGLLASADGQTVDAAQLVAVLSPTADRSGSGGAEFAVYGPDAAAILVEAGRLDEAEAIADRIERRQVQLEPWGGAAVALIRGLVALGSNNGPAAVPLLASASETFERLGAPWLVGQSRLARGVALRRLGRRREAAADFEAAAAQFGALGALPALRRAQDELLRARPRPRRDDRLTAAESRVAALVAQGRTNREAAASLFTTVATVEAHLTRIYSKLGIRSRSELTRRVAEGKLALDPQSAPDT